jgi:hypothetical protein
LAPAPPAADSAGWRFEIESGPTADLPDAVVIHPAWIDDMNQAAADARHDQILDAM